MSPHNAQTQPLRLVSHELCPYVQRAAIVLLEKGVPFERLDVDLRHKPDWFLALSPLGKTPVLVSEGQALFESAVICEYLDELYAPRLHPADALERARHRAWMAFGSDVLNHIGAFYSAPDQAVLRRCAGELHQRFEQLEAVLGPGPYFAGQAFSMVDAVFGPVFRYFDVFDELADFGILTGLPKVQAWRSASAACPSVQQAAHPLYPALLRDFLRRTGSALSRQGCLDLVE